MSTAYDATAIEVLSGLDPVRKRPGMYTDTARPNHLAQEVIDNSVDEALAGHATRLDVTVFKDGSLEVRDNGRGMPVDIHPEEGVPGCRGDPDEAACRRQVFRQELPVFRWPARCGCIGGECPLQTPGSMGAPWRQGIQHGFCRWREGVSTGSGRQGRQAEYRHHTALLAGPEIF